MEKNMNRKGKSMLYVMIFIVLALLLAIFLGLFAWVYSLVDENLDLDIMIGQVNLSEVNDQTFGAFADSFIGIADNLGVAILVMMCFLIILNGYFFGSKLPKLMIIVDIFILIMCFILSIYVSFSYYTLINSSDVLSFYSDMLPKTSTFVVTLPFITAILGALVIFFTYAAIKKDNPEVNKVLGY